MTYNVFGGTLNIAQLNPDQTRQIIYQNWQIIYPTQVCGRCSLHWPVITKWTNRYCQGLHVIGVGVTQITE